MKKSRIRIAGIKFEMSRKRNPECRTLLTKQNEVCNIKAPTENDLATVTRIRFVSNAQ